MNFMTMGSSVHRLYDLDDNGTLEVVVAGMDSRLYVFDHQGQDWAAFR